VGGIKLNWCFIVFSSFATANRVKSLLLKNHGIKSTIMQTPGEIKLKSCSYCLKINLLHLDTAWDMVVRSGLSSKGVFSAEGFNKIR